MNFYVKSQKQAMFYHIMEFYAMIYVVSHNHHSIPSGHTEVCLAPVV